MADAIIDRGAVTRLLDYDPATGVFTRKVRTAQRHKAGDRADFEISTGPMAGYRRVSILSRRYLAHRLAWLFVYGEWPAQDIDHINGDRGDNRIANLRDVPNKVNRQNMRKPRADNACGFLGVHYHKQNKNWIARIQHKRKTIHIGVFDCPAEAHKAYLAEKRRLHDGCTI